MNFLKNLFKKNKKEDIINDIYKEKTEEIKEVIICSEEKETVEDEVFTKEDKAEDEPAEDQEE